MAKLTRVPAKVFAASAAVDEIGQFGSAVAGAKLETADVATIQGLSAWLSGWSEALVSGNRYPALQEMNGLLKVLSYQGAYALQEGIPEYDSATTYYIGSIVKKTGTFELYGSLTNDNVGQALTDEAGWQLLVDLKTMPNALIYIADTSNMPTLSNNGSDANNDIDFGAGFCYDLTTNAKIVSTAMTKRLDATWAAGTNQGGLDTGSKAISTWYHCYAISKVDGTADFLFSASATAPTMPTDYVNKRRIGSIRTDGSGNILGFIQDGSNFTWKTQIQDASLTTVSTTRATISVTAPPLARVLSNFIMYDNDATVASVLFTEEGQNDDTPTGALFTAYSANNTGERGYAYLNLKVNSSSQIYYRSSDNSLGWFNIQTLGYIDNRGTN